MAKIGMIKNVKPLIGTYDNRSVTITVKDIPIGDISVKANIRSDYTGIFELAESIKKHGLLQPITVYVVNDGYVVKAGHRRFMAYKKLYQEDSEKYHSIRCIISDTQNTTIIQLVENVQREDLSQQDLYRALNELRDQGMTLRQIAEVMGKSEGYVKSLFVGVNEINRDKDLKNMIGNAGITIRDVAETKPITDKNQRLELLEERKKGKINREQMREKVGKLSGAITKNDVIQKSNEKKNPGKTHIALRSFPEMNKIIIYLTNGGSAGKLNPLEADLRSFFNANKGKYIIGKEKP
jgi:ParB family chromosome partitioning protein